MGVWSLHIFQLLNLNGGLGVEPPAFGDLEDLLAKSILRHVSDEILNKRPSKLVHYCTFLYLNVAF